MTSSLENLSGPGQPLRAEAPDANELAGLKRSGLRRLADAQKTINSLESRFDLAYNAAHALCLAALRRSGYRAEPIHRVSGASAHARCRSRGVAGACPVP